MKRAIIRGHAGFTLVELLIVISIIGILSSITVVSVGSVRQMARDSKRLADIKQLQTALELYFNRVGGYPTPLPEARNYSMYIGDPAHSILCAVPQGFVGSLQICADALAEIIMARVPANPFPPNTPYLYRAVPDPDNNGLPSRYEITFRLETDIAGFSKDRVHSVTPAGIRIRE